MSTRRAKQSRSDSVLAADGSPRASAGGYQLAPLCTQLAFVMVLAIVIARAMMSETLREAFDATVGGVAAPRGPGPSTSVFLNAMLCFAALLVLLRRVIDRTYVLRWSWSHLLLGATALLAAISVAWSNDKFAAAVTASHVLAAAATVWTMTQLVRSWLRLRIVAGICFGLLLAYSAHGLIYRFVDVPQNQQFWRENREQILADRGWQPDSFSALQFEKNFVAGEMIGFNTSPNSFAAVIVLVLVITAGVAIQRRVSGDSIAWTILIALLVVPALYVLYCTATRTAVGTLFLALIALMLLASSRTRAVLARHHRRAYFLALGCVALITVAVIAHGIVHGTLFHDSLNFRWRYWVASFAMWKQHPLLGVGWSNFGEHYLAVRLLSAAEEIRDPHNFIVRAFTELGLVGGILVLAWLARAAFEITRPIAPPPPVSRAHPRGVLINIACAIGLAFIISIAFAIDWNQSGKDAAAYKQLEFFRRLLSLGLLAIGLLLALVRVREGRLEDVDDRQAPWVLYAMIVALGAFFVHAMMDFVLAEPGPLMLFAAVLGSVIGVRIPSAAGARTHRPAALVALISALLAWLIAIAMFAIPLFDAESRSQEADDDLRARRPDRAAALLRTAFDTLPMNADYAYRCATALLTAGAPIDEARAMLNRSIAVNPLNVAAYLTRAGLELHQPAPDFDAVKRDYETALRLDPQNITIRLDYADLLMKHNQPREAAEQFRLALATNDKYDKTEPKRLSAARVAEIEKTTRKLTIESLNH